MLPAFLFLSMCVKWGSQSGGGGVPPPSTPAIYSSWKYSDESDIVLNNTGTMSQGDEIDDLFSFPGTAARPLALKRGGSSSSKSTDNGIIQGGKTVITRATTFWKSKFDSTVSSVKERFRSKPSKQNKQQQELTEQLQKIPVRRVVVPNSTVLPADVVRIAANRAGMIGKPLKMDRVQDFARNIKRWYTRKGYILHSVTGAHLDRETATATISVEEPVVSGLPVDIVFCKEMVVDEETGSLITFKKYREKKLKEMEKKSRGFARFQSVDLKIDRKDLNTTFISTTGRTKASKIAKAMKLKPGTPFQWMGSRWEKIASSGVFSKVIKTSPEPTTDGGVCLQVFALEPPPRHLEYGIGKSVWTNSWEGEVDFDWRNIFGGGESVGVLVRRGTKDSSPSVRLRYGDDKFGLEGGYDIEAFTDFLGDTGSDEEAKETGDTDGDSALEQYSLLSRRGATVRIRNPISPRIMTNSVASASLEQTSTTTGQIENIGSATLTFGPFRRLLPMEARSSVSTTISGGARLAGKEDGDTNGEGISFAGSGLLPYTSGSATTTQILPLSSFSRDSNKTPITLALKHTLSTSTPNLPRHEAKAMGHSAIIRGAAPDDVASSVLKGTTELRLPVAAPRLGSGSVVLFGDWFCVQKDVKSPFYTKSSIGVGLRKNFQGIPLKYDVCYSGEGKIKTMFGMGADFDI